MPEPGREAVQTLLLDKTVMKRISKEKDKIIQAAEKLEELPSQDLSNLELDQIAELEALEKKLKATFAPLENSNPKIALLKIIEKGSKKLQGIEEENKTSYEVLLGALENRISNNDFSDWKEIQKIGKKLSEISEESKVESQDLSKLLSKVDLIEWGGKVEVLLKKANTKNAQIEKILSEAPVGASRLLTYAQLSQKMTGKSDNLNEKDVFTKACQFLDEDDLRQLSNKIQYFISDCRTKEINDRSSRILKTLEWCVDIFENSNLQNLEQLIDQMFELKLYDTETFKELEEMQGTVKQCRKEANLLKANHNKLHRLLDKYKSDHMPALEQLRQISKLPIEEAKGFKKSFGKKLQGIQDLLKDDIKALNERILKVEAYGEEIDKFWKKYPEEQFLKFFYKGKKFEKVLKDFDDLICKYNALDFSCKDYRVKIDQIISILRAQSLLEKREFDGIEYNIECWVSTYEELNGKDCELKNQLELTIRKAKQCESIIAKIKRNSGAKKQEKEELPTLEEAEEVLKDLQNIGERFGLDSQQNYLSSVISGVKNRLKNLINDKELMFHDLQTQLEFLRKTPLDLDNELFELNKREAQAVKFLESVKELDPSTFESAYSSIEDAYQMLSVKVLEWEDIRGSIFKEKELSRVIEKALIEGEAGLNKISSFKSQYRAGIKYMKDISLEARLMKAYLSSLKQEFLRRQRMEVGVQTRKSVIDFVQLSSLINEVDDLLLRLKTSPEQKYKKELEDLYDGVRFVRDLFQEVKRHLELAVYTTDMKRLNSSMPSSTFKSFVDITGPIIDHKTNLEIKEKEQREMTKSLTMNAKPQKKSPFIMDARYMEPEKPKKAALKPYDPFGSNKMLSDLAVPPLKTSTEKSQTAPGKKRTKTKEEGPPKPIVNKDFISQDLRNYYSKTWKFMMERNRHLDISGLDALLASKTLEKSIYDKIKRSPIEYDVLCSSISNTLKNVLYL